jgi:hypothetical protein
VEKSPDYVYTVTKVYKEAAQSVLDKNFYKRKIAVLDDRAWKLCTIVDFGKVDIILEKNWGEWSKFIWFSGYKRKNFVLENRRIFL